MRYPQFYLAPFVYSLSAEELRRFQVSKDAVESLRGIRGAIPAAPREKNSRTDVVMGQGSVSERRGRPESRDWDALLSAFANSGTSVKGFCREHSLAPSLLRYHLRRTGVALNGA